LIEQVALTGYRYGLDRNLRAAEHEWLVKLSERGILYNRTLPKPLPIAVVEWSEVD